VEGEIGYNSTVLITAVKCFKAQADKDKLLELQFRFINLVGFTLVKLKKNDNRPTLNKSM
jgi:hypothetical protein